MWSYFYGRIPILCRLDLVNSEQVIHCEMTVIWIQRIWIIWSVITNKHSNTEEHSGNKIYERPYMYGTTKTRRNTVEVQSTEGCRSTEYCKYYGVGIKFTWWLIDRIYAVHERRTDAFLLWLFVWVFVKSSFGEAWDHILDFCRTNYGDYRENRYNRYITLITVRCLTMTRTWTPVTFRTML